MMSDHPIFYPNGCPRCGASYIAKISKDGKGFWCNGCETAFTLCNDRLTEVKIRCSKLGKIVPARFCRICELADKCVGCV
jgi:hypothetical protein